MKVHTRTLPGLTALDRQEWDELTRGADTDAGYDYLRFREYLEPGESRVVAVYDGRGLAGALHGAFTTPRTAMTSTPWKFLAADSALRLGGACARTAAEVRARHRELVVAAGVPGDDGPLWQRLAARFGAALVVRGFDRSFVRCRAGASRGETGETTHVLVRAAQRAALEAGGGAVAFPFVDPGDGVLRAVLDACGFRRGVVTAASLFRTGGCDSYDAFLGTLPGRHRRRHRVERRRLAESGLVTGELDAAADAARMAELEAATLAKYGATPDVDAIRRARVELGTRQSHAVTVPAVERDGRVIACALHFVGRGSSLFLSYGCDYEVADRSTSYAWTAFYHPVDRAVAAGRGAVRLGFEGFEAKTQRGATVHPREMWVWVPGAGDAERLGALLEFLRRRNADYLERFVKEPIL